MDERNWLFKSALALLGAVLGAYVGEELVGGGAIGTMVTGAIVAGFAWPLFGSLIARRQRLSKEFLDQRRGKQD